MYPIHLLEIKKRTKKHNNDICKQEDMWPSLTSYFTCGNQYYDKKKKKRKILHSLRRVLQNRTLPFSHLDHLLYGSTSQERKERVAIPKKTCSKFKMEVQPKWTEAPIKENKTKKHRVSIFDIPTST